MKRLTMLLFALAGAVALAGAGTAIGHTAHASAASVVVKTRQTKYGPILVTGANRTLYLDVGDKPPHFACKGGCLAAWPALKATGPLKAQGAAKAANLGSVKDGTFKIVTYNRHPLYLFASDSGTAITGEGVNGFYVVSPSGSKITHAVSTTTTSSSSSTSSAGGYGY
jgi:predicted lipoprotein with Yx(FWY)xxD motif